MLLQLFIQPLFVQVNPIYKSTGLLEAPSQTSLHQGGEDERDGAPSFSGQLKSCSTCDSQMLILHHEECRNFPECRCTTSQLHNNRQSLRARWIKTPRKQRFKGQVHVPLSGCRINGCITKWKISPSQKLVRSALTGAVGVFICSHSCFLTHLHY